MTAVQSSERKHGECMQVVPGKFVAFKGPVDLVGQATYRDEGGCRKFSPAHYLPIFARLGVMIFPLWIASYFESPHRLRHSLR
jgi:hypothetical protein